MRVRCGAPRKGEDAVVSFELRLLSAFTLIIGGLIAAAVIYEYSHP